jgi:hypothetical protein
MLSRAIQNPWLALQGEYQKADFSLVLGYLDSERPLHCRRTLDQYSYYMLETTESRDIDQVVYKWARKQQERQRANLASSNPDRRPKNRPILMVDQLWLWILPDGEPNVLSIPRALYRKWK